LNVRPPIHTCTTNKNYEQNPVLHILASTFYKPSVILQKPVLLDVMPCSLAKFCRHFQ